VVDCDVNPQAFGCQTFGNDTTDTGGTSGGTSGGSDTAATSSGGTSDAASTSGGSSSGSDVVATADTGSSSGGGNCVKTNPPAEICDGKDNDCDGKTDNLACDDGNVCTVDKCDPKKYDGKDKDSGCAYDLPAGAACEDGNKCTEKDACKNGLCQPGPEKTCNDDNSCTLDDCKSSTGKCDNIYIGNGKFCNDGKGCTTNDKCNGGKCDGVVQGKCDDGNPCTKDTCDNSGKCGHETAVNTPCNDGNPCTTGDKCADIVGCIGTDQLICDDDNPCTTDVCDKNKGGCVVTKVPKGALCNKDACNQQGKCDDNGQCTGFKKTCNDDNPCTKDLCDKKSGVCTNQPLKDGSPCNDGDPCTQGEKCNAAHKCTPPAGQKGCNDGNACTDDICDQGTLTCKNVPKLAGGVCDDGDGCTEATSCIGGECVIGASQKVTTVAGKKQGWTDGPVAQAAFNYPRAVAVGPNGVVYVADRDTSRVRSIDETLGAVKTIAGNGTKGFLDGPAAGAQFNLPQGIDVDAAGTIYVSDRNNHRIRVISGGAVKTLAGNGSSSHNDGKGTTASFYYPEGIRLDSAGNLLVADSYNHRIRSVSPTGVVKTVAGIAKYGWKDGPIGQALFYRPHGVDDDGKGNLYVADTLNNRIRKVDLKGGNVTTLAGGTQGYLDEKGAKAKFYTPTDVIFDGSSSIIISDRSNNRIRRVTLSGIVTTLAGDGASGHNDGKGSVAKFYQPWGIALDKAANIYVADSTNHRVRKVFAPYKICNDNSPCTTDSCNKKTGDCEYKKSVVGSPCDDNSVCTAKDACDAAGKCSGFKKPCLDGNACTEDGCNPISGDCVFKPNSKTCDDGDACTQGDTCLGGKCQAGAGKVSTVAGDGTKATIDHKDATKGSMNYPADVGADKLGNVYVAVGTSHRIRKFNVGGGIKIHAGSGKAGFADGIGTGAKLNLPMGLVVLPDGSMYVAEAGNHRIRQIDKSGTVKSYVGSGASAWADGTGTKASFNGPQGIAQDAFGNLYVADTSNHRIRKVEAGGKVTTVAGSYLVGLQDGKGSAVRFNFPAGVAVGSGGFVYVADTGNNAIRRISSDGTVTTLAGKPAAGFADGKGGNAQFRGPTDLDVDALGNIIVADRLNNRIRRVTSDGVVATIAGGNVNGFVDGDPLAARFTQPVGVGIDANGRMFIADRNNSRIRMIAASKTICDDGKLCTKDACNKVSGKCSFKNISSGEQCDDGNPCTEGEVCDDKGGCKGPAKICNDKNPCTKDACSPYSGGCQYAQVEGFCDDGNPCTSTDLCTKGKCRGDVGIVETVAGTGSNGYYDGKSNKARFYRPRGIDADDAGNIFVADYQNHRIRKITPQGDVTRYAGSGSIGFTNGSWSQARFYYPADVAVDGLGNVYVADRQNHRIRKIDQSRNVTTLAGSSYGYGEGSGGNARFRYPEGLAHNRKGTLYIADSTNHRIRSVNANGDTKLVAGSGLNGFQDGPATSARFYYPRGVAIDTKDRILVADMSNYRVRRIATNGTVTTLAGNGVSGFGNKYIDGKGIGATFGALYQIAASPDGGALVVDMDAHTVRKISESGNVSTWAGQRGKQGNKDGVAPDSLFYRPWGIGVGMKGNIYIGEYEGGRVRKIANPIKICDDGNECTVEACDQKTGKCVAKSVADGTTCSDGKHCLTNRVCNVGKCVGGVPKYCNDKNTCTIDSCNQSTGACEYKPAKGCIAFRRVFVTSQQYTGSLGYVEGADAKCASLAAQQGWKGTTWKAWLSGRTKSGQYVYPSTRFNRSSVQYRLVNGNKVANHFSDLVDGSISTAINITESGGKVSKSGSYYSSCNSALSGGKVWTNTRYQGTMYTSFSRYHCNYYTYSTSSTSYRSAAGNAGATNSQWSYGCYQSRCSTPGRLYCFQQEDTWAKN